MSGNRSLNEEDGFLAAKHEKRTKNKCCSFKSRLAKCCILSTSIFFTAIVAIIIVAVISTRPCLVPSTYSNATSWPVVDQLGLYLPFKDEYKTCWANWYAQDKPNALTMLWGMMMDPNNSSLPSSQEELDRLLPINTPYWLKDNVTSKTTGLAGIRVTWLGHGTVLAEVDTTLVLIDPVFSQRASPYQWIGPKRFRPPACNIQDLPENLKAVAITHSHYDHLDDNSVRELYEKYSTKLEWFVPQDMKSHFTDDLNIPEGNVFEMKWWEEQLINGTDTKMIFTPCNHWGRRGLFDENAVLWGSWAMVGPEHRFWVSGDTTYADVFQQIGVHLGPFDLSAIGIGGYRPRKLMKFNHITPEEAVQIHKYVKSKKTVGIHWGAFTQTHEPFMEPKELTLEAVQANNIKTDEFVVVNIGDTVEK